MALLTLRIVTAIPILGERIAAALDSPALNATAVDRPARRCVLRHRTPTLAPALIEALRLLHPIPILTEQAPDLVRGIDAELMLGEPDGKGLRGSRLRVRCADARFARTVSDPLWSMGYTPLSAVDQPDYIATATLRYGGSAPLARGIVAWMAHRAGVALPEQIRAWGDDDLDLYLDLPSPAVAGLPLRACVPVTINADCPTALADLISRLDTARFVRLRPGGLNPDDNTRIRIDPGVLGAQEAHLDIADLTRALGDTLATLGIDAALYPMQLAERRGDAAAGPVIDLPAAAIRAGRLAPWARLHPARYTVRLRCDDSVIAQSATEHLRDAGFRVEPRALDSLPDGFTVRCGSQVPGSVQDRVHHIANALLAGAGVTHTPFSLSAVGGGEKNDNERIEVLLPVAAARDGRLSAARASPARHTVKITGSTLAQVRRLQDAMAGWGCRTLRSETEGGIERAEIQHGCATPEMLDRIETEASRIFGPVTFTRNKAWSDSDKDIFIRLPASLGVPGEPTEVAIAPRPASGSRSSAGAATTLSIPSFLRRAAQVADNSTAPHSLRLARAALIEGTAEELRVADITLPRRPGAAHAFVPDASGFAGFCADQAVAESLAFAARCLRAGHAPALVGPTAASKTWSVLYLAARLNQPVYRLNLSGSADASDLVGRYVPDINRAGAFRWQHGPAPLAMQLGAWLVVDEANLAPSDVLERLNPLLDRPAPRLMLAEGDGSLVEAAPGFSVLATWNGLAYAGRQPLSPAFLDRFKIRMVQPPDEAAYVALGECLVNGAQPIVDVAGQRWRGGLARPLMPELATLVPDWNRFLIAAARFQTGLAAMADAGELRTHGRIAVTRRAFVDMLDELRRQLLALSPRRSDRAAAIASAWQALEMTHLGRLDPIIERPKVISLLTACGITQHAWELPR